MRGFIIYCVCILYEVSKEFYVAAQNEMLNREKDSHSAGVHIQVDGEKYNTKSKRGRM